ncbi:maleylpyruvate isomerase family mycothiol-dependent enzyme [Streptomyces sp. NPDC090306]|uniref:maleylpyruvate isomerase family mycothiol-dependent enzyme n=1 Tax=Streptomyces sp. NPDC090306 TaxID=3365961 RepID=UPI00380CEE9E
MDASTYLAHLRADTAAFRACLTGPDADLDRPVTHCGDWTLRDLAEHMVRGNNWAARSAAGGGESPGRSPAPDPGDDLLARYDKAAAALLTALDVDPDRPAWTFAPPGTVAFWQRRRAQESLVHRWDAEHALGRPGPLDPELSTDGVAEVFAMFVPRRVGQGALAVPDDMSVRLTACDTEASWTYGTGPSAAAVTAPARDLLLALWGRAAFTAPAYAWEGDAVEGRRALGAGVTP